MALGEPPPHCEAAHACAVPSKQAAVVRGYGEIILLLKEMGVEPDPDRGEVYLLL